MEDLSHLGEMIATMSLILTAIFFILLRIIGKFLMTIEQIKSLAKQGESNSLEFKASTAKLQAAFATICAFLNGKGGTVLIGVSDKGLLVGQDVSDNTRREIAREINKIEPTASVDVHYIEVKENKFVITIHVGAGDHVPYIYDGRSFQRNESQTDRMSQHRYEQLLVKRGQLNHSWDEQTAADYDIDSLEHEEIRNTIRDGVSENRIAAEVSNYSIEQMLKYLKLLKNGKVTNAAVVLYAKDVEPDYSRCLIRMTRYRGVNKLANFMDSKHVYGNAFKILSEANYFTMRHLPIASFFESNKFERIDKPTLPVMAVREALINAISHRNYTNLSASISFSIFDDRLEIWNNGTLPPELKLKDLKKSHESYPRNKKISKIFYSRGWVEKAGIGTVRMIEDCKKLGIPEPKFEEYSSGFAVIFKFEESIGMPLKTQTYKVELSHRQKNILEIVRKHKTASIQQIVLELENPPSERMIRKDLNSLKKQGLILLRGSKRGSLWVLNEDDK
jgi:ATP-dependent DNA helicase RecG